MQAHDGIRTRDLFLTKEVLYRLSYMGPDFIPRPRAATPFGSWHDMTYGAGNGIRTRDPELGRLALYQLSYSRPCVSPSYGSGPRLVNPCGGNSSREELIGPPAFFYSGGPGAA